MASAAITLSSTIFVVDRITRIQTVGSGTRIYQGSASGNGRSLGYVDVTESLATVVTTLGNAIVPLTIVENGLSSVAYFPIRAIRDVVAYVSSPINAIVTVQAPSGLGATTDTYYVTETAAAVAELLNDNAVSDSKYLQVTWTGTVTVDLTPYLNNTDSLFINFVGTTQSTTALTLTGIIPPNMDIKLLFNANTTLTVTLNTANVIAAAGTSTAWTNILAITGASNLFEITAIGDNVTNKVPVVITKHTLAA
jgi:hypothetical protein